jgi:hypothetical protein
VPFTVPTDPAGADAIKAVELLPLAAAEKTYQQRCEKTQEKVQQRIG